MKKLKREIRVNKDKNIKIGSCNSCNDYEIKGGEIKYNYKIVNVVIIGRYELRLCNKCRDKLLKLLKKGVK